MAVLSAVLTSYRWQFSVVPMFKPLPALLMFLAFSSFGCGGSAAPAEHPASEDTTSDVSSGDEASNTTVGDSETETSSGIPTSCHEGTDPCTPDPRWVKKLCADVYPAVALYLFQKSSPFAHGYLSRKTRAVNASGGATSGDEWLSFDEEVVLLYQRGGNAGGIQVSGSGGGYDALRLDGSCVTLDAEEVRMQEPPKAKYTRVPWRYIGDDMQDALREVPAIKEAYIERRKECQGAFSGTVSDGCVKKDEALNRAIVSALLSGEAQIPQPAKQP